MKTVIITGASRGIGKATADKFIAEGWQVIGTSTSGKNGLISLDLSDTDSIKKAVSQIKQQVKSIDVLINNAAIAPEPDTEEINLTHLRQTLEVNLIGTINFTEQLIPHITAGGQIINISSGMGSLIEASDGIDPGYRISKAALNMFTKVLASRLKQVTISSFDPGWVKTDMGGPRAFRQPHEPADELFQLANSAPKSGQFWHRNKIRNW
jgi:NAD(P)-dependent dehydrogenase (short-subunit alcohol dehydrogenase family)